MSLYSQCSGSIRTPYVIFQGHRITALSLPETGFAAIWFEGNGDVIGKPHRRTRAFFLVRLPHVDTLIPSSGHRSSIQDLVILHYMIGAIRDADTALTRIQ